MAGEKKLQTKILNDLRSYGRRCRCFKIERCSDNGVMDIFFTTRATGPWLIEAKDEGEDPRKNQHEMIDAINKCGGHATHISTWSRWVEFKSIIGLSKNNVEVIHP